jgi:hypothetical protein
MGSETLAAFAVNNTRAYRNEFEQVLVPFQSLNGQFDTDNAVVAVASARIRLIASSRA